MNPTMTKTFQTLSEFPILFCLSPYFLSLSATLSVPTWPTFRINVPDSNQKLRKKTKDEISSFY